MNDVAKISEPNTIARLPLVGAVVAVVGLIDALYLTVNHYTKELVPCAEGFDCEKVLSSSYAEIGGIPLSAFGVIAYFIAFSLATLAAFGNRKMWLLFSLQVTLMAMASAYFVYLQVFIIKAICLYCMVSAGVCLTLFALVLVSRLRQD